jgi:hypothetical protein
MTTLCKYIVIFDSKVTPRWAAIFGEPAMIEHTVAIKQTVVVVLTSIVHMFIANTEAKAKRTGGAVRML